MTFDYRFVTFFFLSISTLSLYSFVDQFQTVGDNLLLNGQFNHGLSSWDVSQKYIQSGSVKVEHDQLFVSSGSSSVTLSQTLAVPVGQFIRVSANAVIIDVVAGEKGWQKARVYLVNVIDGKSSWSQPHLLFSLEGTHYKAFYQEEFAIQASAEKLKLGIDMPKGGGTLILDDLSVFVVEKSISFQYISRFLMFLWFIVLVWIVLPLLRCKHGYYILVGGLIVLTLMVVPSDVKMELTNAVSHMVKNELPAMSTTDNKINMLSFTLLISKVGHFFAFFLLTFVIALFRKGMDINTFLILSSFAAMTEILQLFSINRQASVMDFGINFSGILLASLFVFILGKFFSSLKSRL